MKPGFYRLVIKKGSTLDDLWYYKIDGVGVNFAGWSARAQVRSAYGAPDPPILDMDSANGDILLGTDGRVELDVPPDRFAAAAIGEGVWDLRLFDPAGKPHDLLYGPTVTIDSATVIP